MATILTLLFLCFAAYARAGVTVYSQQPIGQTATGSAAAAAYTGYKAYNPTMLNPPPLPNPLPPTQFGVNLQPAANQVQGLSIPQSGAFFGISIETSVITQVCKSQFIFVRVPEPHIIPVSR